MAASHIPRNRPVGTCTRRGFLKSAALGAAATWAAPALLRAGSTNERLNIAVIGCGGRGARNMQSLESENIVALCDVNEADVDKAAQQHTRARKFTDFRQLYDQANLFDAVVVSTCEHTHAVATLPALQLGKHVYCEKPLTHNVWEARVIREAAAKSKAATQMGTQNHANDNYRRVVELVQAGAVGPVREAHVWVSRAWGWHESDEAARKNGDRYIINERPKESQPVPPELNWDLWLGPAPERPFHATYFPGPRWYRWWEFANGTMSDLGSHDNDVPFTVLDLWRSDGKGGKVLAPLSV
ncbi:MAG: Gfo/Idh/MocA family oxidoreductase, partial [Planctomycetaceae bacterium]